MQYWWVIALANKPSLKAGVCMWLDPRYCIKLLLHFKDSGCTTAEGDLWRAGVLFSLRLYVWDDTILAGDRLCHETLSAGTWHEVGSSVLYQAPGTLGGKRPLVYDGSIWIIYLTYITESELRRGFCYMLGTHNHRSQVIS